MKKSLVILLILFLNHLSTKACLNFYYSVDHHGHLHSVDDLRRAFNTNFNLPLIEKKLKKIEAELKVKNDYKLLSDYAVLLLKAGKTQESLEILAQLSVDHPNEYQIAANLGTAYELNGAIEKAIHYIKRGMELNPNAHGGSEWVHLKVLETKLQLKTDPSYLSTHSVLNLKDKDKDDSNISHQILIQVRERFPFSPPSNPIMASLLMDLGDCFARTTSIEFAKVLYTIAKNYYGADEKLADKKAQEMLQLRAKYDTIHPKQDQTRKETFHLKIGSIRYQEMLDDNNPQQHNIDWETVTFEPKKLLAYLNSNDHAFIKITEAIKVTSNKSSNLYYTLLILGILSIVSFFLWRRKEL